VNFFISIHSKRDFNTNWLNGSYQIINNKILLNVRLKKGNTEVTRFEIKDFPNDKEKLAAEILEKVQLSLK
jgi:hypothetical protein